MLIDYTQQRWGHAIQSANVSSSGVSSHILFFSKKPVKDGDFIKAMCGDKEGYFKLEGVSCFGNPRDHYSGTIYDASEEDMEIINNLKEEDILR